MLSPATIHYSKFKDLDSLKNTYIGYKRLMSLTNTYDIKFEDSDMDNIMFYPTKHNEDHVVGVLGCLHFENLYYDFYGLAQKYSYLETLYNLAKVYFEGGTLPQSLRKELETSSSNYSQIVKEIHLQKDEYNSVCSFCKSPTTKSGDEIIYGNDKLPTKLQLTAICSRFNLYSPLDHDIKVILAPPPEEYLQVVQSIIQYMNLLLNILHMEMFKSEDANKNLRLYLKARFTTNTGPDHHIHL